MIAKSGYATGKCGVCGKEYHAQRPADSVLCDCYKYCPLCDPPWTVPMTPFTPDNANPITYRNEDRFGVKGQALEKAEWNLETLYVCCNHTPPYYSNQKPVEVKLT